MAVEFRGIGQAVVPAGGSAGQVLVKNSADPFDVAWGTVTGGGGTVGAEYVTDDELAAALEQQLATYVTSSDLAAALQGKQNAGDYATAAALSQTETFARNRVNHIGTQTSATIADFTEAVQDAVSVLLGAGSNVTLNYDDAGNKLTVTAAGGTGGTLDAEAVRDAIGVALVGVGNIAVTVNDAADTITITTTATVNSTDAALRDRSTHTGTQAISTVSGLQTALDGKAALNHTTAATSLTGMGATFAALIPAATPAAARATIDAPATAELAGKATVVPYDKGAPSPDMSAYPSGYTIAIELDVV